MEPADLSEHDEFLAFVELAEEDTWPRQPLRARYPQRSDAATDHTRMVRKMQSLQQTSQRKAPKRFDLDTDLVNIVHEHDVTSNTHEIILEWTIELSSQ